MAQYLIVFIDDRAGGEAASATTDAGDDKEAMQLVFDLRDNRYA
jgi:hypothetical protein